MFCAAKIIKFNKNLWLVWEWNIFAKKEGNLSFRFPSLVFEKFLSYSPISFL